MKVAMGVVRHKETGYPVGKVKREKRVLRLNSDSLRCEITVLAVEKEVSLWKPSTRF